MNQQIRRAAWDAIKGAKLTQKAIAEQVGMTQPAVSRLLLGTRKGDPDSWQQLLDALGLKLVAVPKETDVSKLMAEKGR